jgi:type VI protein secretion system component Hcp
MADERYFLKIDGMHGDSSDRDHKGEIEVLSFSFPRQTGVPAAAEDKENGHTRVEFLARDSLAGPQLLQAMNTGRPVPLANLEVWDGKDLRYELTVSHSNVVAFSMAFEGSFLFVLEGHTHYVYGTPPDKTVQPEHAGWMHEARYARSRPGGM